MRENKTKQNPLKLLKENIQFIFQELFELKIDNTSTNHKYQQMVP